MELELKHLAPYLPYGLKGIAYVSKDIALDYVDIKGCNRSELYCEYTSERYKNMSGTRKWFDLYEVKPILLPISSLYTEMEDGKVPMKVIGEMLEYDLKKYTYDDGDVFYGFDLTDASIQYKVPMEDREIYLIYFDTQCNWFKMVNQFLDVDSDCEYIPFSLEVADYLDSLHFDWRYGLIDKGVAIDKTKIK